MFDKFLNQEVHYVGFACTVVMYYMQNIKLMHVIVISAYIRSLNKFLKMCLFEFSFLFLKVDKS